MRPDAGPQPTQLPENHWLPLQKEEEELAIRPMSAQRLCVDAQYPKHPEKAKGPLPTTVASDPTRPDRMPLLPCFHKASSQLQYCSSTHFRALSRATIGSGCFHGLEDFCLLSLLRLPYAHSPAQNLTGVMHVFPIFSFDAFVQRLTEGIPVSINQGRAPIFQA